MAELYSIKEETMSAIADAVREKTGDTSPMTSAEVADKVLDILSGTNILLQDNELERFDENNPFVDKMIRDNGNLIDTQDITSGVYSFHSSGVTEIPFAINFDSDENVELHDMFNNAQNLTELPEITPVSTSNASNLFHGCSSLEEISEDFVDNLTFINPYGGNVYADTAFNSCSKLETYPATFMNKLKLAQNDLRSQNGNHYLSDMFAGTGIEHLDGLPVLDLVNGSIWDDISLSLDTDRLRTMSFETNNGVPIQAGWWKRIQLTPGYGCGYTNYTKDPNKQIIDDATYALYKNDPDAWTNEKGYALFNHDALVDFLNTVPSVNPNNNVILLQDTPGYLTGDGWGSLTDAELAAIKQRGWAVQYINGPLQNNNFLPGEITSGNPITIIDDNGWSGNYRIDINVFKNWLMNNGVNPAILQLEKTNDNAIQLRMCNRELSTKVRINIPFASMDDISSVSGLYVNINSLPVSSGYSNRLVFHFAKMEGDYVPWSSDDSLVQFQGSDRLHEGDMFINAAEFDAWMQTSPITLTGQGFSVGGANDGSGEWWVCDSMVGVNPHATITPGIIDSGVASNCGIYIKQGLTSTAPFETYWNYLG